MGFEFQSDTKEATKSINVRVPLSLFTEYEAEAGARQTSLTDLVIQAMRFALQEARRTRTKQTRQE